MNVLIVGGAGYVGTILRPALEKVHTCRYLDLRPVPGAADRTFVGDVNNEAIVAEAVAGQDALVYLAMGTINGDKQTVGNIDAAFDVNVRGFYRTLAHGLTAGVQRVCLASSISVYQGRGGKYTDESHPANSWQPYGLSKRIGELICEAAAQQYPQATIIALRLAHPYNEQDWAASADDADKVHRRYATGPEDLRRLFLRALELDRPGCHVVQASGDLHDQYRPNHRVRELLGWTPENR